MIIDIQSSNDANHTRFGCAFSEEETPVPISNTEAKLFSANDTAVLTVGK